MWLRKWRRIMPKRKAFSFKIHILQFFLTAANRTIAIFKPLLCSSTLSHYCCYKHVTVHLLGYFNSLLPGWNLGDGWCTLRLNPAIYWRH